jgi:hypothetical protein
MLVTRRLRVVAEVVLVAACGLAAVVVPVALDPAHKPYDAAFLPIVRTAVEGMESRSLAFLAAIGFVAALVGRAPWWLLGVATVAALPLWSAVDVVAGSVQGRSDHNLLPFEWAIYGALSGCGIFGAGVARWVRTGLFDSSPKAT